MLLRINGKAGDYIVKNESSIFQYKKDENGRITGEGILHIITDSIENQEDRSEITKKIVELNF